MVKKTRLLCHFLTIVTRIIMIMTILNDIMTNIFISITISVIALANAGNDEFVIDVLKYVWWPKIGPDLKHGGFSEICPGLSDLALALSPSLYTHPTISRRYFKSR